MRFPTKLLSLLPIALLNLALGNGDANAATFTPVLKTGQSLSSAPLYQGSRVINGIRSIAIDSEQNIVAITSSSSSSLYSDSLYLFNQQLVPTLVDVAPNYRNAYGSGTGTFITASINNGSVIYLSRYSSEAKLRIIYPRIEVKVGTPGSLQVFFTGSGVGFPFGFPTVISETVALDSGKAVFLGQPPVVTQTFSSPNKGVLTSSAPNNLTETIAATNPVFGTEPFNPLEANQIVRASGNNILLVTQNARHYRVFKKTGTAAPRKIYEGSISSTDSSSSCGASMSGNNLVLCNKEVKPNPNAPTPYNLLVKLGDLAAFQRIPLPSDLPIEQPSIGGKTVIFKAIAPNQERLYVSTNAQAPVKILATGDTLDGKVISKLNLSEQGQSLSNNTIVFLATFVDGSVGLYRGNL
jgi:hypothetical protein